MVSLYARRQDISDIFIEVYRAYPASFLGRSDVELTNSIILPTSALFKLSQMKNFGSETDPITFRIMNIELNYSTHCGVLDFTGDEDVCYLPIHMFNRLNLMEGAAVNIRNVYLEKGKFIKFRPHKTEFVMYENPKVILENGLRTYICVTKGDTISISFNKKNYYLDVLECKPKDTICLTNVDVEVDFSEPIDYQEYERTMKSQVKPSAVEKKLTDEEIKQKIQDEKFKGNFFRLDGKKITDNQVKSIESFKAQKNNDLLYDPRKHRIKNGIRNDFLAFAGKGMSIGRSDMMNKSSK